MLVCFRDQDSAKWKADVYRNHGPVRGAVCTLAHISKNRRGSGAADALVKASLAQQDPGDGAHHQTS